MPEKVRVSPAAQAPLSTGPREDQAASVLLELPDDDPPDDEDEEDDPLDDEDPLDDDPFDEDPESEDDEDEVEDSLLAGTVLVPVERLSFR
jgi:hypothetical protein